MSDESALPAKICYAPPAEIPHPPHDWTEMDWEYGTAHPDEPIRVHAWYCDGWAAITPGFVSGLGSS